MSLVSLTAAESSWVSVVVVCEIEHCCRARGSCCYRFLLFPACRFALIFLVALAGRPISGFVPYGVNSAYGSNGYGAGFAGGYSPATPAPASQTYASPYASPYASGQSYLTAPQQYPGASAAPTAPQQYPGASVAPTVPQQYPGATAGFAPVFNGYAQQVPAIQSPVYGMSQGFGVNSFPQYGSQQAPQYNQQSMPQYGSQFGQYVPSAYPAPTAAPAPAPAAPNTTAPVPAPAPAVAPVPLPVTPMYRPQPVYPVYSGMRW